MYISSRYTAMTVKRGMIDVLSNEFLKKKQKYHYLEFKYEKSVNDFKKKAVFIQTCFFFLKYPKK